MSKTFLKRKYNPSIKEFLDSISLNPHKNFPAIAEVFDDFYVMEYIEGKTLCEIISENPLSLSDAKNYILQLIDAVEVLHGFNIVHRDIKPENIIITDDGTLKLIDFDISRKIIKSKSRDTEILGTIGYAAPEQYGFTQTDERSDIYAIGAVYNFMLTGKLPIEETACGQYGKIIKKCTAIDNSSRYKNLQALRHDIRKECFTTYNFLDIIPGFRTRNFYKEIIATLCYVMFFVGHVVLAVEEGPRDKIIDIALFYMMYALYILADFVFFALGTNFLGFTDKIKFPIKNKVKKAVVLMILWYFFCSFLMTAMLGNLAEGFLLNPITASFLLFGYLTYSILESFIIGMQ